VLSGRDAARLKAVADSIVKTNGVKVVTLVGDAGLESTQKALVDLALSTFGALHIAFNNAGAFPFKTLVDISAAEVDLVLNTNVRGVIYALKYQLPAIANSSTKDNWGSIINNSSVASTRVVSSLVTAGVYAATKAAVDTLTKFAALEGAAGFVRVNAVNPGNVSSEGLVTLVGGAANVDAFTAGCSLVNGAATPDELSKFVLFIADNKTGRFFNGSTLLMDGGMNIK
jgi:NAD(P)-dependent dehydrogenase (short-subunit alcohol dehydrogenase family)